jgi:AcrR family transcriptional regulator
VAKGSLYHSFGSKRQLFGKVLALYGRMQSERAEEFFSRPGTAKERIRAHFVLLVDADLDGPVRRRCLARRTRSRNSAGATRRPPVRYAACRRT